MKDEVQVESTRKRGKWKGCGWWRGAWKTELWQRLRIKMTRKGTGMRSVVQEAE